MGKTKEVVKEKKHIVTCQTGDCINWKSPECAYTRCCRCTKLEDCAHDYQCLLQKNNKIWMFGNID